MDPVSLLALETALPPHSVTRDQARLAARAIFGAELTGYDRLERMFDSAAVDERRMAMPIDWYMQVEGWPARLEAWKDCSLELLEDAARRAAEAASITLEDIDQIVCVSTTGFATPSLDALLIQRLGLKQTVKRTPVFGWGCAGGAIGLSRAATLARGEPGSIVLLLVVELCSLTFRREPEVVNLVGASLFGDGAAAALLQLGETPGLAKILGGGEHVWPDTEDIMGWRMDEAGFGLELRRDLPTFLTTAFKPVIDGFLASEGQAFAEIDGWIPHPGGPKVMDAIEQTFELEPETLMRARDILRKHGNMSAATILFVLKSALEDGVSGRQLLTALGPGFTGAATLMDL